MNSTTFFDRLFDLIAGKGEHLFVICAMVFIIAYLFKSFVPVVGPGVWNLLVHAAKSFSSLGAKGLGWVLIRAFNFAVNLCVTVACYVGVALYCLGMYLAWRVFVWRARNSGRRLPVEPNYPGPPGWIAIARPPKAKAEGHGGGHRH